MYRRCLMGRRWWWWWWWWLPFPWDWSSGWWLGLAPWWRWTLGEGNGESGAAGGVGLLQGGSQTPPPTTTTSYCQLQHQESDISSTTLGSDKAWDPSGWQGRPGGLPPPIAERMRELKICCDSAMESTEERRNMCTESLNLSKHIKTQWILESLKWT